MVDTPLLLWHCFYKISPHIFSNAHKHYLWKAPPFSNSPGVKEYWRVKKNIINWKWWSYLPVSLQAMKAVTSSESKNLQDSIPCWTFTLSTTHTLWKQGVRGVVKFGRKHGVLPLIIGWNKFQSQVLNGIIGSVKYYCTNSL